MRGPHDPPPAVYVGAVDPGDADALADLQRASYARAGSGLRGSWPEASAMDGAELAAFLAERTYGILATASADGRPQAAPIAFFVHDRAFWFATVAGARLRNVRHTPHVSFVVMDGEGTDHRAVSAEGRVTVHRPEPALAERWQARHGSVPDWAAAYLRLDPERVFSYSAGRAA